MKKEYQTFEMFQKIAQEFAPCMHDYLYVYDIPNDTYYITEQALDRFLVPGSVFHDVMKAHEKFVYPEDMELLAHDLQKMVSGEKTEHDLEYRWVGKDGSPIWINCKGRMIQAEDGSPHLMIGCINEIGKRQSADNISGLLSEDALKKKIFSLRSDEYKGNLLRIGIDDFKAINEGLGMNYGNFILSSVADCIKSCIRKNQFVFYIISDEFMVLDLNDESEEDMEILYDNIRSSIDIVIEEQNYKAVYTISGGIVPLNVKKAESYDDLIKLSEFALSEAKRRGKNQVYSYNCEDYHLFLRNALLLQSLKKSVAGNCEGFSLYFQPIVDAQSEELFSAEALLRYVTAEGVMVSPVEFVPLLESSGLIIPVGKWVIREALAMCKQCQKKYPKFKININISYVQLMKSAIFDEIMDALYENGLDTEDIIIELTESGHLENSPSVRNVWQKLKLHGIKLAIDDFGTGYANLYNIGNLRPDIVKIDRSFTLKALKNENDYKLLIYILDMIHCLGLKLVIEGIEELEELRKIIVLQPDYIQGFYYGRPCPKEEFFKKYDVFGIDRLD